MSVFSKIKMSKKAAKAHKAADANKENVQPAPYRHVPVHAAADAMSGCPQAWVDLNKEKIIAYNRAASKKARETSNLRREAASRAASIRSGSSSGRSIGGVSIKSSSSRIVLDGLPQNYKANAYHKTFSDPITMGVERPTVPRVVSSQSLAIGAYVGSSYGSTQRMKRGLSYQDSAIGRSPLSSQVNSADHSRVNSSGNSTISSENLEMAMPSSSRSRPQPTQNRYTMPASKSGIKRNTSDPKISSSLRSSVINADSLPTAPAPAVVRQGPMPVAKVEQPQVVELKQKKRMSLFSKRKTVAATA